QYDPAESRVLVDALMAWQPGAMESEGSQATPRTLDFIVGMHRTGTTLLVQLLDASPQVRCIGELNDFTAAMRRATDHYCKGAVDLTIAERAASVDFAEVGHSYMEGIAWRLGDEPFFTDKQPANFLNIGFIC